MGEGCRGTGCMEDNLDVVEEEVDVISNQRGGGQGTGCLGRFILMNNVDVSDPMRNFTQEEYNRLHWNSGWDYVMQARE